jgi:hypothetical protein
MEAVFCARAAAAPVMQSVVAPAQSLPIRHELNKAITSFSAADAAHDWPKLSIPRHRRKHSTSYTAIVFHAANARARDRAGAAAQARRFSCRLICIWISCLPGIPGMLF